MQVNCRNCDWTGPDTALLSGEDDGHGLRGVCPSCGADEEEFEYQDAPNKNRATQVARCKASHVCDCQDAGQPCQRLKPNTSMTGGTSGPS